MKKKLTKIGIITLFILISAVAIIFLVAWKSPDYYVVHKQINKADHYIPFAKYDSISDHERPLIIRANNVVIFGAEHTRNSNDAQIMMIQQSWDTFKPTIALVEGRMGFLLPGLMDPVETLGENGKVKALAHASGVPLYNWDLSKEELAKQLLDYYLAEQVALAQILNPYFSTLRFGRPASPEGYVEEYLKRAEYVNEQENIKTVADIDRLWKKYFPSGNDWRETSDENGLPGFLGTMMNHTNDLRNRQLISAIAELQEKGERVFVVCGSSHAACIKPAITGS